jgi:hypothetical protein
VVRSRWFSSWGFGICCSPTAAMVVQTAGLAAPPAVLS